MKFFVRTYGCQMNVADSNEMGRHLKDRGLALTENPDEASIMLVNTCTVRHHAEERAFSEIGRLKKWKAQKPGRKIVLTGCAAERTKEHIEDRFPYIDLVVGAKSIVDFPTMIETLLDRRATDDELDYAVPATGDSVSSFVTIMRGCNYSCTYCIVPSVRGRESYQPMETVLGEVRDRVREGVREITLLGQTVNSYHDVSRNSGNRGRDTDFSDLLEAVAGVDGVERIRFMSPHPYYMTDRVIDSMARVPQVCEALHMPVQSGSSSILKKMARNYTRDEYLQLIEKLRSAMPEMTISTDIIVGFPGETDADFGETLSLIEEARLDWGFIFKYSQRDGTPAADLPCFSTELIEERHQACLAVSDRIALEKRSKLTGTMQEILVEDDSYGRTRGNYKVHIAGNVRPGETIVARITDTERPTLEGSVE
jgi:tRNA-2-methylthio-N6-dimethylallyladenosine synthase